MCVISPGLEKIPGGKPPWPAWLQFRGNHHWISGFASTGRFRKQKTPLMRGFRTHGPARGRPVRVVNERQLTHYHG
jgi:hypothetical protein